MSSIIPYEYQAAMSSVTKRIASYSNEFSYPLEYTVLNGPKLSYPEE